jgi:hypothetical protein
MALALGSLRYPLTADKLKIFVGVDVDVKQGGAQIEYTDQDPRIHTLYLSELAKNGVASQMGDQFDEAGWRPGKVVYAKGAKPATKTTVGKDRAARKRPTRAAAKTRKTAPAAKRATRARSARKGRNAKR